MHNLRTGILTGIICLAGATSATGQLVTPNGDKVYFDFQVERPVRPDSTNKPAVYPRELRTQHIQGDVITKFVVDTTGKPDMSTFEVVKTDHELFTESVKAAVTDYHFSPATLGGHKVRQLVQMPFYFRISPEDQRRTPPM